jgi:crotonobetainyl-CoA:carnitine CoA-transferase CaiB-like acyl-CoA transferase
LEAAGVPAGPINALDSVFKSEQVSARQMRVRLAHDSAGTGFVDLIGNPLKLSHTAVHYSKSPPKLGEDTEHVLQSVFNFTEAEIKALRSHGILGGQQ